MATTEQQLLSFVEFARNELQSDSKSSIEELFSTWRMKYPSAEERAEVLAAIRQGDEDITTGNYRMLDEFITEFRSAHNIPPSA